MWRLRPLTFLALSQPRLAFGTVAAARTDWESITAAVGSVLRPAARRAWPRNASCSAMVTPVTFHRWNRPYTVRHGGKPAGTARHTHPLCTTYRIASTTARRQCASGRPPRPDCHAGAGNSGASSDHSASLVSEG
jgi:hypothetical protein